MNIDFSAIKAAPVTNSLTGLNLAKEGFKPKNFLSVLTKGLSASLSALASGNPGEWNDDANAAMHAFATTNKFTYTNSEGAFLAPTNALDASDLRLPNPQWKPMVMRRLQGKLNSSDFRYYCGIFANDATNITAMQISLPTEINKLYVGLKYNFKQDLKKVILDIKNMEERTLEGDFPSVYNVYSQKDDTLTAHYILSPEVMNKLMDNKMFDIWIEGNTLTIYTLVPGLQIYLENIQDYFGFAELLLANIDAVKNHRAK